VISRELARQNELDTHLANCTGQRANIYDGNEFAAYDDEEVILQVTCAMFVIATNPWRRAAQSHDKKITYGND
jgi:hypothetical protein